MYSVIRKGIEERLPFSDEWSPSFVRSGFDAWMRAFAVWDVNCEREQFFGGGLVWEENRRYRSQPLTFAIPTDWNKSNKYQRFVFTMHRYRVINISAKTAAPIDFLSTSPLLGLGLRCGSWWFGSIFSFASVLEETLPLFSLWSSLSMGSWHLATRLDRIVETVRIPRSYCSIRDSVKKTSLKKICNASLVERFWPIWEQHSLWCISDQWNMNSYCGTFRQFPLRDSTINCTL